LTVVISATIGPSCRHSVIGQSNDASGPFPGRRMAAPRRTGLPSFSHSPGRFACGLVWAPNTRTILRSPAKKNFLPPQMRFRLISRSEPRATLNVFGRERFFVSPPSVMASSRCWQPAHQIGDLVKAHGHDAVASALETNPKRSVFAHKAGCPLAACRRGRLTSASSNVTKTLYDGNAASALVRFDRCAPRQVRAVLVAQGPELCFNPTARRCRGLALRTRIRTVGRRDWANGHSARCERDASAIRIVGNRALGRVMVGGRARGLEKS
jgi:hypothetical protein